MSLSSKIRPVDDEANRKSNVEERAQNSTPVHLQEDKPTTLLAMNLDPSVVRKSSHHINRLAAEAGKMQEHQKGRVSFKKEINSSTTKLDVPEYNDPITSIWDDENEEPSNTELLHPQRNLKRLNGSMSIPMNKMSIKLYGSAKAVLREQTRMQKAGKWIVHPYSNFRFIWDCVSLVLLLANIILIPFAIAFWREDQAAWIAFKIISDLWFFFDIIINFRTGVVVDGPDSEVILDPKQIRVIYLKTWFTIDLVSTFPFDLIFALVEAGNSTAGSDVTQPGVNPFGLFRLARIIGLLRLLRLSKFIRYIKQWEEIFNFQYEVALAFARIINLIMLMLFLCHLNGCLQYMVPMFQEYPENSWVYLNGLQGPNVSTWEKYSWSVFKSTSHMLCIGYGRGPPSSLADLWVTFVSMVSGAITFAMFIGNATSLIQSMDASKRAYKEKYMQVREYMQFRKLPMKLRRRITDYYENRFQGKMFDEERILSELNHNLRDEIITYNCKELVAQVPFFREADSAFLETVLSKLEFEVFLIDDVIVKEGSLGSKMYFISRGTVVIRSRHHNMVQRLSDGSYFGEIALLQQNNRRVASVVAETYCYLYSLSVEHFNIVLDEFPKQRQKLHHVASTRLAAHNNEVRKSSNVAAIEKGSLLPQRLEEIEEVESVNFTVGD